MNVKQYLDSTYLKTAEQAGIDEHENRLIVRQFITEAIEQQFKLIMIRPEYVVMAKEMIVAAQSKLAIGTVIDFPEGQSAIDVKLAQAEKAIADGADDLDFVCNYEAFKNGDVALIKDEILQGTQLGLQHHKTVKWIIEVAALDSQQIVRIASLIKNVVMTHFREEQYEQVFVKSSTGFYQTAEGQPNGATKETIIMMLENAAPLPVKAAGGVRTFDEAVAMIQLGVKRIGTSAAKAIADGKSTSANY